MDSKKTKVALLFGGCSAEHEISLLSASAIYQNMDKNKYDISCIYIDKSGRWKLVPSPLLIPEELEKGESLSFLPWESSFLPHSLKADIYFPVLHGPYGEDGTIQGLFEMAFVPYVGAGVLASAIGMDKATMKTLFRAKNLPVVHHVVLLESEWASNKEKILARIRKEFSLPFFVKPANLGSSIGITKVKDYGQTAQALSLAFTYDRKILVEEGIEGRELECSVLGNDKVRVSLPGEIIPAREFYDYQDKYIDGKTAFVIPVELPPSITREVQRLATEAFRAIDGSGMARVDFFYDEKRGKVYVNEINTIPGFTEISMYPKLWEVSGLSFSALIDELIRLGWERFRSKKRCVKNLHS